MLTESFCHQNMMVTLSLQKTGCLFTADRSDDKFIQPEGLPKYAVAPPSLLDSSSGAPVMRSDAATESLCHFTVSTINF